MSTETNGPDTDKLARVGPASERKRAALALGILAVAAVVLVGVMVLVLGSSDHHTAAPPAPSVSGPAVTVTGGQSQPSAATSTTHAKPTPTHTRTSATATRPRSGPVSCPTSAPCSLPDDVGNALGALNDYRTGHGQNPVTGKVTRAARACAVSNGDNCHSDFFWEPVGRSGKQVISKIAASGGKGTSWLLDRSMSSVQIGWAYVPSSKSFECALIAKH